MFSAASVSVLAATSPRPISCDCLTCCTGAPLLVCVYNHLILFSVLSLTPTISIPVSRLVCFSTLLSKFSRVQFRPVFSVSAGCLLVVLFITLSWSPCRVPRHPCFPLSFHLGALTACVLLWDTLLFLQSWTYNLNFFPEFTKIVECKNNERFSDWKSEDTLKYFLN